MRHPKRDEPGIELLRSDVAASPQADARSLDGEENSSFAEYIDVVIQARWLVIAAIATAATCALAYAFLASPVYRTSALVQVESKKPGNTFLSELAGAFSESSPAETEMEVLRSRAMLGAVVRELKLDVRAHPRRFPLVGAAVARRHKGAAVAQPFLGRAYGWGGEHIRVDRVEVPDDLRDRSLTLVAGEGGAYTLEDSEGAPILQGQVGIPASGRGVEILVSELRARPGLEFTVLRRRHDEVVSELQRLVRISEKGKKTGIIQISLDGGSPTEIAEIVDALSMAYERQNVERRSAEAEKTLAFLQTQLPALRTDLDNAEAELERYRARRGSVDVTLETQAAITRAAEIERALAEIRVEQAALRERFTESHPVFAAVAHKGKRLEAERAGIEGRLRKLPEAELESARRMRNVKVANELYLAVLNKAQELRVVKEGTIGNVRILDAAVVPFRPVAPSKLQSLILGVLVGLVLGVAAAFAHRAFAQGVEDPDEVERTTSVPVNASVPHSEGQEGAERRARGSRGDTPLLAASDPKDLAIESLRSLRTSLQFALVEARNQIVAISGPAPGVGKSFVTANLAHLLGDAGKRVLVIDCDLRRGQLHHHFGLDRGVGLSDAIAGEVPVQDAIRATRSANVSAITTGSIPPNPAELLGSERFHHLLQELAPRFDLILVDTPPVLAVTDAALVARSAGVCMLVLRAGRHPMREILASIRAFKRNGIRVHGIVMNDVRLDRGLGRRNAYHYQYRYE